jgi:hypothetical protein
MVHHRRASAKDVLFHQGCGLLGIVAIKGSELAIVRQPWKRVVRPAPNRPVLFTQRQLGAALGLLDQQVKGTLHLRAVNEPCHRSDYASKRPIQIHVKGDTTACLSGFAAMIEVHR